MAKRIIFVSRRNSLRSVLAQACLAHLDADRFTALSCGLPTQASREIHPAAMGALHSAGIPLPPLQPRGWDELIRANPASVDFVITLDESIRPLEPSWPGQPITALWAFPDAAALSDPEQAGHMALQILYTLRRRLELLVCLPIHGTDDAAIRSDIRDLGHMR